ncbi:hypothetical protein [Nesterenkonia pannonica]|nr:hypothetical protein [Nesterenkonia pannonica]
MASTSTKVRDVEQEPVADDEFIHHDHIGHGSTPLRGRSFWASSSDP